jgi:hypothetical protein
MSILTSIKHRTRIQDIRFIATPNSGTEVLLVSSEDKNVAVYGSFGSNFAKEDGCHIVAELTGNTSR